MKIDKKEKYTLISSDENSFEKFYTVFNDQKLALENQHLVVHLSDSFNIKNNEISLFLDFANLKKENGTSFVIVDTNIDIDNFPETFNIAPTLQEAEDILEMEAIERSEEHTCLISPTSGLNILCLYFTDLEIITENSEFLVPQGCSRD